MAAGNGSVHFEDGWYEEFLVPQINRTIMRVTAAVRDDAKRICPVDTGALRESLVALNSAPMTGRVSSHLPYCAAVELGFHGLEYVRPHTNRGRPVRGHVRWQNTPSQPFLRPSLYRVRDLGSL